MAETFELDFDTGLEVDAALKLAGTAIQPGDVAVPTGEGQADGLLTHQDKAKLDGLGSAASCDIGTGSGDVAAGDHTHADATPAGEGGAGAAGFLSAADKATLDGLGTAAFADTGDFATSAQGSKADTAVQPTDVLPVFIKVKNVTDGILAAGTPIYPNGTVGDGDVAEVIMARADTAGARPAAAILNTTLAKNGTGTATVIGQMTGIDTSGLNLGNIYLAPTGGLTNTAPTDATHIVQWLGTVERKNATTGIVYANVTGPMTPVVDALNSTSTTSPLSAAQGKALKDALDATDTSLAAIALVLSGPSAIYAGYTKEWTILSYQAGLTYSASVSAGSVSVTGDKISLTAPETTGTITLTASVAGISHQTSITVNPAPTTTIGFAGSQGFGVAVYTDGEVPTGFAELTGTQDKASDNFGNYQFTDGSIMCWVPKFYYRIGSASSPRYADYGAHAIDIATHLDYADESAANAAGYALHRAFKNGGAIKDGFMVDKYQCSNHNNVASSIKNGNPLSSNSAHNPFSGLTGLTTDDNYYHGALKAAKTRGSQFHCMSRFEFAALALLATAHGQAATATTYCAWYDSNHTTNFPKGNNNNAPKDVNDTSVIWQSDGYTTDGANSAKTGSAGYGGGAGNVFAKSTHNGQNCGVADLNGNMWEINLGLTRPGSSAGDTTAQDDATAFYVLKESVDVNALTGGWSDQASGNEAWGTATHLATLYDAITLSHIGNNAGWAYFGNSGTPANATLSNATSGDGYKMTGLGIYTADGHDATGLNLYGKDGIYEYHLANLCLLSGGSWYNTADAGVWALGLYDARTASYDAIGLRCSAYV